MTTGETIPAHGGRLLDLLATGDEAKSLRERAAGLRSIELNSRSLSDLELLTTGGYSPLDGFMTQDDYRAVVAEMHLAGGLPWPMSEVMIPASTSPLPAVAMPLLPVGLSA